MFETKDKKVLIAIRKNTDTCDYTVDVIFEKGSRSIQFDLDADEVRDLSLALHKFEATLL